MMVISMLMISLAILVAVAFYTLLERKILSYIQLRKGPNKVSIMGLLQPFSDAIKLFSKTPSSTESTNYTMTLLFPPMTLMVSLLPFPMVMLYFYPNMDMQFNMLVFLIISSLSVYTTMMIGWATNSKYSNLGTIRNVAQMISYEISFFLIILNTLAMTHSFNMYWTKQHQSFLWYSIGMAPMLIMWLTACLAEVNRSPFDFSEGESELVSGFNVEYAGGYFALIFLAEYANMILLSFISSTLFFNNFMMTPIIAILLVWARGTLPRFRYDLLMNLNWKMFLPMTLMILPLSLMLALI